MIVYKNGCSVRTLKKSHFKILRPFSILDIFEKIKMSIFQKWKIKFAKKRA